MAPNFPNDVLPSDGVLSLGFVVNIRMIKAQATADYAVPVAADTKNMPLVGDTSRADTLNASVA